MPRRYPLLGDGGGAMLGGTTLCSPSFPRIPSRTASAAPRQILLHQSIPPVDDPITSMPPTMEQGGQAVGDFGQDTVGSISVGKETSRHLSNKKEKKVSGKAYGETQQSDDARVERQITSKTHVDQRDSSKVPISETVGSKRSLSRASESSRARKAAKIINAKVEMT